MTDIYNPFSLIKALSSGNIQNFWASSGATTLLPKFVDHMELRLKDFESCPIMPLTLETSDVTGGGPELFLYQSGYLTIKSSDEFGYILGFPNEEVKHALHWQNRHSLHHSPLYLCDRVETHQERRCCRCREADKGQPIPRAFQGRQDTTSSRTCHRVGRLG